MKILVIGNVLFSHQLVEYLIKEKINLVGVVTTKKNIYNNSDYSDMTGLLKKHKVPIHKTNNINEATTYKWIKKCKVDLIFCLGWSRLLSVKIINLAKIGTIGFHPSLLPLNRGRHPLIWPIISGQSYTGSSFFLMNIHADAGDIVSQDKVKINSNEKVTQLYSKIIKTAKRQIKKIIIDTKKNNKIFTTKQKNAGNILRKRDVYEGIIDWRMNAVDINNLVNALNKPYSGASFIYRGMEFKLWSTKVHKKILIDNNEHGKIIHIKNNKNIIVKCGRSSIELMKLDKKNRFKKGMYL